jgi:predicted HTH transcriptional regulator
MPEKRLQSLAALARFDDPLSDKEVLLQRLKLERPESRHLEWKLTLPFGPSATTRAKYRTVKTIIAYANTDGGFIIFGIDPHGRWAGVPQAGH